MADRYVDDRYPSSAESSKIIAACFEVHNEIGPGFEEVVYQRALAKQLPVHGLEFDREVDIELFYKGAKIGKKRVDFVVEECLLEIKAKRKLEDVDIVQTLSYLKASGFKVGLLVNFGGKRVEIKRLVH
jgi:GxxExxY protein